MRVWIIFHRDLLPDKAEVPEILRFHQVAKTMGVELQVLKPQDFELVVATGRKWQVHHRHLALEKPDYVIARTGAETRYFTLSVLRQLAHQGVELVNDAEAIEATADKLRSLQILAAAGIPIPRTILGKFPVDVDLVERELGFPVVVKTLKGTRGSGVLLCQNREQFGDLASLLGGANPGEDFIFQRYVRASHGRDVRLLVVGGKVVAAMERRARDGGFKSNVSLGGEGLPFDPPRDMKKLAIKVAKTLKLDIAGVDILFDDDGYQVCEANSSPGFQGLEKALGIDVPEIIFEWLFRRHARVEGGLLRWFDAMRDDW